MKKWDSLIDALGELEKKGIKYVVLRNIEDLKDERSRNDFFSKGHDIDILCDQKTRAKRALGGKSEPLRGYFNHYLININGSLVRIGLQYIGDRYYDPKWEKDIIDSRIKQDNLFFVPEDEQYFYSKLYHACIHKTSFNEKNKADLFDLAYKIGLNVKNEKEITKYLIEFMNRRGYVFTYPLDISVQTHFDRINDKNITVRGYYTWRIRRIFLGPYNEFRRFMRKHLRK